MENKDNKDSMAGFFENMTIVESDGSEHKMTPDEASDMASALTASIERTKDDDWPGAARQIEEQVEDLVFSELGGNVPIQGYGTYKGLEFYFRARYSTASLSVGSWRDDEPPSSYMPRYKSSLRVTTPGDDYGAGWLTPAEVVAIFPALVANLEPRTKEDGEAELEAFSEAVRRAAAMMRQGDELRGLPTTEDPA